MDQTRGPGACPENRAGGTSCSRTKTSLRPRPDDPARRAGGPGLGNSSLTTGRRPRSSNGGGKRRATLPVVNTADDSSATVVNMDLDDAQNDAAVHIKKKKRIGMVRVKLALTITNLDVFFVDIYRPVSWKKLARREKFQKVGSASAKP